MSESEGAQPSRRLADSSPAAPASPLEDDDLLREILLRLPPQPSSLPRASAVCKGWRALVTDPKFGRSFSAHHGKPPLLGFFEVRGHGVVFTSVMDSPDRIPPERFDLGRCMGSHVWEVASCRHGRALVVDRERSELLVFSPITGELSRVAVPPEFNCALLNGAVLCSAGDQGHVHGACHRSPFKVVLLCIDRKENQTYVCVYSSQTGTWGDLISAAAAPSQIFYDYGTPETLVGNALYWLSERDDVIEFDLDEHSLTVIKGPPDTLQWHRQIIQAEDGSMGFDMFSCLECQMWRRNVSCHGVATWVLWKTIEMHTILGLPYPIEEERMNFILGYCEDNNVIFIYVSPSVYMVQLKSMQSKRLDEFHCANFYRPFTSFYTPGTTIAGGSNEAEISHNT